MLKIEQINILVTDPDAEFLDLALEKLSKRNFLVHLAITDEAAIDILVNHDIHAVVLDLNRGAENEKSVLNYINRLENKPILLSLFSQLQMMNEA
jgi:DNA-binding response OmpR family regulator